MMPCFGEIYIESSLDAALAHLRRVKADHLLDLGQSARLVRLAAWRLTPCLTDHFGCHLRLSLALEVSGLRRCGSSMGISLWMMLTRLARGLPSSFCTFSTISCRQPGRTVSLTLTASANSRMVNSSWLPMFTGLVSSPFIRRMSPSTRS